MNRGKKGKVFFKIFRIIQGNYKIGDHQITTLLL